MKKFLLATATVIVLTGVAHAGAKSSDDWAMMGAGTHTCAQFANEYRRNPGIAESVYFTWAQGYMSAIDVMLASAKIQPKNLNGMSVDREEVILRDYCNAHPLAMYKDAVEHLMDQLPDSKEDFHFGNTDDDQDSN